MSKNTPIKKSAGIFEQIKSGLEDSIEFAKGELTLKTTKLPSPPPEFNCKRIRRLRHKLHMSQAVFAATLNVSSKTVQSWEQDRRNPGDASLRLLEILEKEPALTQRILGQ
jgi:putative transcriptional regulator